LTVLLSILFNDLLSFSLFFFSLLTLGLSHNGKQETGRDAKDKKEKDKGGKGEKKICWRLMVEANKTAQARVSAAGPVSSRLVWLPPADGLVYRGVGDLQKYMRYRLEDGTRPDTLAGGSPKVRPAERWTVLGQ